MGRFCADALPVGQNYPHPSVRRFGRDLFNGARDHFDLDDPGDSDSSNATCPCWASHRHPLGPTPLRRSRRKWLAKAASELDIQRRVRVRSPPSLARARAAPLEDRSRKRGHPGLRRRSVATTALLPTRPRDGSAPCQSGVALRLPPQSRTRARPPPRSPN